LPPPRTTPPSDDATLSPYSKLRCRIPVHRRLWVGDVPFGPPGRVEAEAGSPHQRIVAVLAKRDQVRLRFEAGTFGRYEQNPVYGVPDKRPSIQNW
jgi:hypothetical protein